METLVANFVGSVRREKFQGRDYLVAPLTLIVPGVLNGSLGALLYPLDEIRKNPIAWNGMPLTVGHPTLGDAFSSARTPEVLEAQGIGVILNASVNGKLTAEGWFDIEKTRSVNLTVLNAIELGQKIDLSTGLFTDNDSTPGVTENGVKFTQTARNYRPDHVAVLLNEVGACSVEDGCGVNVNQQITSNKENIVTTEEKKALVDFIIANCDYCEESDRPTLNALSDEKLNKQKASLEKDAQEELVANAAKKGFTDLGGNEHTWNAEKQEWVSKLKTPAKDPKEKDPVANTDPKEEKPQTEEEWLATAPVEIQNTLAHAKSIEEREKANLIGQLTANVKDEATKKGAIVTLNAMGLTELRSLVSLVPQTKATPQPVADWAGAAPTPSVVSNQSELTFVGLPDEMDYEESKPQK